MAISGANPCANQSMIAVHFFEGLICCKEPNEITKLFEIHSSFLQAFDILLELAGLDYWLHLFPAVNQGIGAFETLQIATRTRVFQSLFCFFIRDFHSKGQTVPQSDLRVKHPNGFGGTHAKAMKNRLRLFFRFRVDTTVNSSCFHAASMCCKCNTCQASYSFSIVKARRPSP